MSSPSSSPAPPYSARSSAPPSLDLGAVVAVIDPALPEEPSQVLADVAQAAAAANLRTVVVGELPAPLRAHVQAHVAGPRTTRVPGMLTIPPRRDPRELVRQLAGAGGNVCLVDLRATGPGAAALADVLLVVCQDADAGRLELVVDMALAARLRDLARDNAEALSLEGLLSGPTAPADALAQAGGALPRLILQSLESLRVDVVGEGPGSVAFAERLSERWGVRLPAVHRRYSIGVLQTRLLAPNARELRRTRVNRTRRSNGGSVLNHVRAEPRHRVQRACRVETADGTRWGAWLVDISGSGVGLMLDAPVHVGDVIGVELPDGMQEAEIKRVHGRQVGASFTGRKRASRAS
ncbi:MAG: PilZ domain-containing protein [Myxococcota bacterium]